MFYRFVNVELKYEEKDKNVEFKFDAEKSTASDGPWTPVFSGDFYLPFIDGEDAMFEAAYAIAFKIVETDYNETEVLANVDARLEAVEIEF